MKPTAIMFVVGLLAIVGVARTQPASGVATGSAATTTRVDLGPDVVVLDELVELYQPVPFNHRAHAEMAEMWSGCVSCHHRPPVPGTTKPTTAGQELDQAASSEIPACKTCHPTSPEQVSLRVPSLKGAYHRQCLNCHREWAGSNQCGSCHAPIDGVATQRPPMPDDIVGRMHPPIPEPEVKLFRIRVAPVAGPNVLFRHEEHVRDFGIACSSCHRRDTCTDCHAGLGTGAVTYPDARKPGPRPLQLGRTWKESHAPCTSCHADDGCAECHYRDDQPAPPAFEHRQTGQILDELHTDLACRHCHPKLKTKAWPSCGDATCHYDPQIVFPLDRPGPVVPVAVAPTTAPSLSYAPATRPIVIRIRRGGT